MAAERQVKQTRLRLGLSQERFARLLGVSLQTVRRWELGLNRPLPIISVRLEEIEKGLGPPGPGEGGAAVGEGGKRGAAEVGSGMGGLFKGMGSFMELISKIAEQGKEESTRSGQVEALGGKVKGVYGFTVRVGLGGKPVIEQFGNLQETEAGPVVTETREPLADVLDEGEYLYVIVELPGIEEKDIHVKVEGDILEVVASTRERRYRKEVLLPAAADPKSMKSAYRNGVLEVRLARQRPD